MKSTLVLCSVTLTLTLSLDLFSANWPAYGQSLNGQSYPQTVHPLKSGDRLQLTVVGFPDLSGEQLVMADGTLQIPLVGFIQVGGLTPAQATQRITEALGPYVRYPQVGLSILSQSPIRISVSGEVLEPGPRLIASDNDEIGSPTTLSGALSLAGGITPNANLRNIIIRRAVAGEDGAVAGSGVPETELSVDLWRAIQTGDLEADLRIYDGDEIIVPTAQISSVDQQLLLTSTVAPTTVTVQVAGAVNDPGQIEIDPQAGVSAAVAAAGGLTDEARSDTIALFRMSADGQLAQQTFTFGEASPPILEGDLIVVDRSTRSNVGGLARFFNLLLNPVNSILNVFD